MALTADPADLVGRVRRDVGRNLLRARNGVKYVTGIDRPQVGPDAQGRRVAQGEG